MEAVTPEPFEAFEIVGSVPAPVGWHACYLVSYDQVNGRCNWMSLPVVLWVTVHARQQGAKILQEIRPFVAYLSGEVVDYQDNEHPFLCLVPPDEDMEGTVRSVMENDGARLRMALVRAAAAASTDLPS